MDIPIQVLIGTKLTLNHSNKIVSNVDSGDSILGEILFRIATHPVGPERDQVSQKLARAALNCLDYKC